MHCYVNRCTWCLQIILIMLPVSHHMYLKCFTVMNVNSKYSWMVWHMAKICNPFYASHLDARKSGTSVDDSWFEALRNKIISCLEKRINIFSRLLERGSTYVFSLPDAVYAKYYSSRRIVNLSKVKWLKSLLRCN